MKKIMLLITFLLYPLTQLYAGTSGSLSISGFIAVVNDISVSANSQASNLDILNGENGTYVADINELSNNPDGYSIQVSSQNSGKLVNTTNSTYQVSYQLSYNNSAYFSPSTYPLTAKTIYFLSEKTNAISTVKIKFPANKNAGNGNYEDVVTLSIVAN